MHLVGETLHALAKRHVVSRNLIRIWAAKYEARAFDDDARAADLIQEYEAKIAALVGAYAGAINGAPPAEKRQSAVAATMLRWPGAIRVAEQSRGQHRCSTGAFGNWEDRGIRRSAPAAARRGNNEDQPIQGRSCGSARSAERGR